MIRRLTKLLVIYLTLFYLLLFYQNASALVVLQYHHISEETPKSTSLSPKLFKQHLDYLSDNNFQVLSLQQVLDYLQQQKKFPDKSVLITFDDGYTSIYDTAFPLLKNKQFPFTLFVNIEPLNQNLKNMLNWAQLEEMQKNNATIANHSVTHAHLTERLENETTALWQIRVTDEISKAQIELHQHLKTTIKVFAYPYGEFNAELKLILKDLGYVAFGQQSGAISYSSDQQALARFPFAGSYGDMTDFVIKVNSLPLPISAVELVGEKGELLKDHHLSQSNKKPQLKIKMSKGFSDLDLHCYLSGLGEINKIKSNDFFVFQSTKDLPPGRSRYNCTAKSEQAGRVYWFSQPWFRVN